MLNELDNITWGCVVTERQGFLRNFSGPMGGFSLLHRRMLVVDIEDDIIVCEWKNASGKIEEVLFSKETASEELTVLNRPRFPRMQ